MEERALVLELVAEGPTLADRIAAGPVPIGGKQQVSSQGGRQPAWGPGGRELFYRSGTEVMAVTIAPGATFSPSMPHALFPDSFFEPREAVHAYFDISPDGRRSLW